ncbi:MAG: RNA polymerase-binding protein DksA [Candidatus Lightella neohaematopini]|nr:RNA polymerase-binding protein DksA [Candidatus Lightella neohaematopini]MCV2528733.1 RNA polymerase-binding protein DksA [Candidatus Lightella neohaematopini]
MNRDKFKSSSLSILNIAGVKPYNEKSNEKYMNNNQIMHFKTILHAWYKHIINNLNHTNLVNKFINFPDIVDRAMQEEEFNLMLHHCNRERKIIINIQKTIKRLEENKFGFCDYCDIEIGIKRLEANPITNLCIDCKTMAELKEKQVTKY